MAIAQKSLKDIMSAKARVDHAKVAATSEAAIRRQMIADGEPVGARRAADSFSPLVIRKRLGLTQSEFAAALGIPVATLRNWEQGRNAIDPAARALLILVAKNPKRALATLAGERAA